MTELVVLHIPHASKTIPQDILESFVLTESELRSELNRMTDSHTEELFAVSHPLASAILYPVSRLVVDPERFENDEDEPMSQKGMGIVYTKTSSGDNLRKTISSKQRDSLIQSHYIPHQEKLAKSVANAIRAHGFCLIIDCHSFSSMPLPYEFDQSRYRPDICIGTDEFHTPIWVKESVVNLFTEHRFRVELNRPFSGTMVPAIYYRSNPAVHSVMIEVNRSLYMNEDTGLKRRKFDHLSSMLHTIIQSLIGKACERTN